MKNTLFVLFFILIYTNTFSQDFQGVATYQSKTTMDGDFGPPDMPEARKQEMLARMRKNMEKTFILNFDKTTALYKEEERLSVPSANRGPRFGFGGATGIYYKDVKNKAYKNQIEMFGKIFLINDSLSTYDWQMTAETKKIGNYTCYKATAIKKPETSINFRDIFRPKEEDKEQEAKVKKDSTKSDVSMFGASEPKEKIITAWFTPEIPINQGPSTYWGLPGLILEVNDGRTTILCNKIVLNPKEVVEITAPSKGKKVSQEEYNKIMAKKMKEMSERFRGNNRRQQGPPHRN